MMCILGTSTARKGDRTFKKHDLSTMTSVAFGGKGRQAMQSRRQQSGKQTPLHYRVEENWAKFPANGSAGEAVGVACDSHDRVHVFLRGPQPVQIFEPDGTHVASWGEGLFSRPHGIFIGPDDTVYCTDDHDHTVRAF